MLTLDMLFAVLHGLPANHLDYLDRPWYLLASRIERALKEGQDPYSALRSALSNSPEWERQSLPRANRLRRRGVYLRAFLQEELVMALPVLWRTDFFFFRSPTRRCSSDASSLPQLSRILVLDRSYTRRLLEVLIEKGYAIKYFRRDGTYYLAISSPMSSQARSQVTELIQAFKQALLQQQVINESPESSESHKSRLSSESRVSPESRVSSESRVSPESPESPKSPVSSK